MTDRIAGKPFPGPDSGHQAPLCILALVAVMFKCFCEKPGLGLAAGDLGEPLRLVKTAGPALQMLELGLSEEGRRALWTR